MIVKAVRTSLPEGEVEPRVECRFETYGYNKQLDATSCGFFVVLYSELYVFRGEDRMRIAGFDIDGYRRSVVGLVQHLYEELVNGGPLVPSESGECNTPLAPSATSLPCGDSSSPDHAALTCEPQSEMLTASVVAQSTAQDRRSKAQSAAVSGVCAEDSSSIAVTPKPASRAANGFYSVPPLNLHETLDQHKQRATHPSQIISHCYACSSAFSGPNGTSCRPESGSDLTHSHSFCRMCVIDYFNRTKTATLRVAQGGGGVGCARLSCPQFLACESLTELLSSAVMIRIREHCEKEMLLQMTSLERCKNPKCDYAVEIEAHPAIEPVFHCVKCQATFCRICKRDERRHGPFTCHSSAYQDGWSTVSSRARRTQRRDEQPVDGARLGWLSFPGWRK